MILKEELMKKGFEESENGLKKTFLGRAKSFLELVEDNKNADNGDVIIIIKPNPAYNPIDTRHRDWLASYIINNVEKKTDPVKTIWWVRDCN